MKGSTQPKEPGQLGVDLTRSGYAAPNRKALMRPEEKNRERRQGLVGGAGHPKHATSMLVFL